MLPVFEATTISLSQLKSFPVPSVPVFPSTEISNISLLLAPSSIVRYSIRLKSRWILKLSNKSVDVLLPFSVIDNVLSCCSFLTCFLTKFKSSISVIPLKLTESASEFANPPEDFRSPYSIADPFVELSMTYVSSPPLPRAISKLSSTLTKLAASLPELTDAPLMSTTL